MFEECDIHSFPIDCFAIAKTLHYVVRTYSSLDFGDYLEAIEISEDAFSRVESNPDTGMNQYVIYYNDRTGSSCRIRWSIFHEIGHIYLGHHDNPDDSLYKKEEAEANFFARYASAPCPLVYLAKCQCDDDVAKKFDLSTSASHWAYVSFQNWLNYGPRDFLPFEIQMLQMFRMAVA